MTEIKDSRKPEILVVIPLYNHAGTVYEVARRCRSVHKDVLVVDDGSTDLRPDVFSDLDIKLIRHEVNSGKGTAIMTAVEEAGKNGFSHIVTIDADLQHIPEDIVKFKTAIFEEPDAVYVGKRDFEAPNVPGSSVFGRQFSNFWYRVQTGKKIGDAQSGFRAYPVSLLEKLKLSEKHYSFEVEVLVRSAWAEVPVKDIDISVFYPEKEKRVSHFSFFKDNLRLTHLNTKLTIRSFIPIPHKRIYETEKSELKFSIFSPIKSIRLFLSNNLSPSRIAFSGAVGVFLGTLPLIGIHTLIILFVSGFFRLNKIVSVGTSQLCMPPFVPAICIGTGYFICHDGKFLTEFSFQTLGNECLLRIYEWFIGSLFVAPALSLLTFFIIYTIAMTLKGTQTFIEK